MHMVGRLGSAVGPVIQATRRSEFEDGLVSGDFVWTYLTILKLADHALFKIVWYVLLRPLRPELDGRPSSAHFNYSCTKLVTTIYLLH
jgi:hypothetical protein